METLKRFTAAETYLLLNGRSASFKDLMKYTFMDLVNRKVLAVTTQPYTINEVETGAEVDYVSDGPEFANHAERKHESAFLYPFKGNQDQEILLTQFIKTARQSARSRAHYIWNMMLKNEELGKCIKTTFWQRVIGSLNPSEYGQPIKEKLQRELKELEVLLPQLLESDPEKALALVTALGGNIYLINSLDFKLLKKADEAFAKDNGTSAGAVADDGFPYYYYSAFDSADSSFDSGFDSGFDAGGGDGGSGCGGSGCGSGCGGGCGGCGG